MLSPEERDDIQAAVRAELAEIEQMCNCHGSYRYCCEAPGSGVVVLSHKRFGRVLRSF